MNPATETSLIIPRTNSTVARSIYTATLWEKIQTFAISSNAKILNQSNRRQEDGYPNSDVVFVPVVDGQTNRDDFKGKSDEPSYSICSLSVLCHIDSRVEIGILHIHPMVNPLKYQLLALNDRSPSDERTSLGRQNGQHRYRRPH